MSKHARWLWQEIDGWVTSGLVSREQADRIRAFYPAPKEGLPWGTILFSGLGAVVAGLGVILLFAYNWQAIPKAGKLGVIFLGLAAAHGSGLGLFLRRDWRRQLGEALCLLGTMFFGAAIWLIAQIYHIEEHFPNGFLIWTLGAMAMAYALPSTVHGALSAVLVVIWASSEAWNFHTPVHWAPAGCVLVGGLAWWRRSRWLLVFALVSFAWVVITNATAVSGKLFLRTWINVAAFYVGMGVLSRRLRWFSESGPIWSFLGWAGFLIGLFVLTFPDAARMDLAGLAESADTGLYRIAVIYGVATTVVAVGAWVAVLARGGVSAVRDDPMSTGLYQSWCVPLMVLACLVSSWAGGGDAAGFLAAAGNLVFLALSASWMAQGCRAASLGHTIIGSVMLACLSFARYFDLFDSLAARGAVFLAVGGVLFAEGILYTRARRRLKGKEAKA